MLSKIGNAFQKQFISQKGLTSVSSLMFSSGRNPLFRGPAKHTPFYDQSDSLQTRNVIAHNVGMKQFLTRVYNTTALSICGAIGSAYIGMSIPALMMNPGATSIVSGLVMIGSFLGVSFMKPKVVSYN